jgi:hypothetical protein
MILFLIIKYEKFQISLGVLNISIALSLFEFHQSIIVKTTKETKIQAILNKKILREKEI